MAFCVISLPFHRLFWLQYFVPPVWQITVYLFIIQLGMATINKYFLKLHQTSHFLHLIFHVFSVSVSASALGERKSYYVFATLLRHKVLEIP